MMSDVIVPLLLLTDCSNNRRFVEKAAVASL